jgi:hypothetical protein
MEILLLLLLPLLPERCPSRRCPQVVVLKQLLILVALVIVKRVE